MQLLVTDILFLITCIKIPELSLVLCFIVLFNFLVAYVDFGLGSSN